MIKKEIDGYSLEEIEIRCIHPETKQWLEKHQIDTLACMCYLDWTCVRCTFYKTHPARDHKDGCWAQNLCHVCYFKQQETEKRHYADVIYEAKRAAKSLKETMIEEKLK